MIFALPDHTGHPSEDYQVFWQVKILNADIQRKGNIVENEREQQRKLKTSTGMTLLRSRFIESFTTLKSVEATPLKLLEICMECVISAGFLYGNGRQFISQFPMGWPSISKPKFAIT
jgi:hypothetical protein